MLIAKFLEFNFSGYVSQSLERKKGLTERYAIDEENTTEIQSASIQQIIIPQCATTMLYIIDRITTKIQNVKRLDLKIRCGIKYNRTGYYKLNTRNGFEMKTA